LFLRWQPAGALLVCHPCSAGADLSSLPVSLWSCQKVSWACPISLHRVMELTGMSAELAETGLAQLAAMNLVITGTDGTYRAA